MTNNFLDYDTFRGLIDVLYDEVNIWDSNYKLLYINNACEQHYGMKKEEMIGKDYFELVKQELWEPMLLPKVYEEKRPLMLEQRTHVGGTIISIAKPIFDENHNIKYVVSSVKNDKDTVSYLAVEKDQNVFEKRDLQSKELMFKSEKMEEVMKLARIMSAVDAPIIISGESGTGKSMLAKVIHDLSDRKKKPFITVNCGAIPRELMESELFGYEEGAFTGARKQGKKGIFEAAEGGTILLDDIAELPYIVQSKLLQVVQEKEFMSVGSRQVTKANVKIITTSNRDLKEMVECGNFREDLYYRLSVFEINIPPLRARREDIEVLAYYFLGKLNNKYKRSHQFAKEVMDRFRNYSWKGNVRELAHLTERMVVTVQEEIITEQHLPNHFFDINDRSAQVKGDQSLEKMLDEYIEKIIFEAVKECKSTRKIAEKLEISQSKASRLIRKYVKD